MKRSTKSLIAYLLIAMSGAIATALADMPDDLGTVSVKSWILLVLGLVRDESGCATFP